MFNLLHSSFSSKAQGSIEYLVSIAVVIVLSLVVVGFVTMTTDSSTNIASTSSKILQSSDLISISEAVVSADGNGLFSFSNNLGEKITVTSIRVNDFDYNYSETLFPGEKKSFFVKGLPNCDGLKKIYEVSVFYNSENGLDKSIQFGQLELSCTSSITPIGFYVIDQDYFAPVISLSSPASGFSTSLDNVSFTFDVNDYSNLSDCTLIIDGVDVNTISSPVKGVVVIDQNLLVVTPDVNHFWDVSCVDVSGNIGTTVGAVDGNRAIFYTLTTGSYLYFNLDENFSGGTFNFTSLKGNNSGITCGASGALSNIMVDLIAYYPLDSDASDMSGNDYDGVNSGATTTTGVVGNAFYFNGGTYITLPSDLPGHALDTLSEVTVSSWAREDSYPSWTNGTFLGKYECCNASWFNAIHNNAIGINPNVTGGSYTPDNPPLQLGDWVFIAFTLSVTDQVAKGYYNGQLVWQTTVTTTPTNTSTSGPFIGKTGWGGFYGAVDEVTFWNRALTADEMLALYNSRASLSGCASDANYISPVIDTTSETASYNLIKFNSNDGVDVNGHLYGSQLEPAIEKDLNDGLVGLWHLNETSGTSFTDSSNYENNVSCSSCPDSAAGLWDLNAQNFDGSTDYLTSSKTLSQLGLRGNPPVFSVSAWFKMTALPGDQAPIVMLGGPNNLGNYDNFSIQTAEGDTRLFAWGYCNTRGATDLVTNKWYHYVETYDGSTSVLYLDGVVDASLVCAIPQLNDAVITIGRSEGSNVQYFNGVIDEVAVWNRVLDANEVKELLNKGASKLGIGYRSCANADCSDGSWSDINYSAGVDIDLSGLASNRYFQFLVKPELYTLGYIDVPEVVAGCSGNSEWPYCEWMCAPWDPGCCASYDYWGGNCALQLSMQECTPNCWGGCGYGCEAILDESTCMSNVGCWWDGVTCYEDPMSWCFPYYYDPNACQSVGICTYYEEWSCTGTLLCSSQTSSTACAALPGCTWTEGVAAHQEADIKTNASPTLKDVNIGYAQ
ncbi:MAG: LamG domain-containing protein [archaeon]